MVNRTCSHPECFPQANDMNGQPQQDIPLPPPFNPAQMLATQNELLRQLIEIQRQEQQHHHQDDEGRLNEDQPNVASFPQFQGTNPPMFTKADEPLEADAWLRIIESKFALLVLPCPSERKVMFAV